MSAEPIETLLKQKPGQALAFLLDNASAQEIAETLAAFANSEGGVLFIGLTRTGLVTGLADPDRMEQCALSALLQVEPPMSGGVTLPELVEYDGHSLLMMRVPPGLAQIYRVGPTYLQRVGTENQAMSTPTLREVILNRRDTPFERLVPDGAEARDLSRSAIEQYLERMPGYDPELPGAAQRASDMLRRRGVLRAEDGRPTYAGLLLFGREPQQWLPSAQILIARYPGPEMGDTFLRQQIDGPLPQQIAKAESFLIDNMRRGVIMEGLQREEKMEYPREAVREAIVNAVAHRDYAIRGAEIQIFMFSDRIELLSPGRLPGHITLDNIMHERFSRNELIVQVLSDLGFIERLGYGIDRIFRRAKEHGLQEPQLAESANGFRLTFLGLGESFTIPVPAVQKTTIPQEEQDPLARWKHLGLNPRQLDALAFIERDGRITNRDFQELAVEVSPETLRRDLSDLVDRGILLKIGEKKATYYILK
ncbi:MAG: putative DNA binding domain-containing protein [Ardenticatenales bacterium]|nr:putative DNA binding domain-containing protein [Ardenticatenales bacterium]